IAETPAGISAIRLAMGEAHALIGGDLVVSGGAKSLSLMRAGQTGGVVNSHEIITGDFTRNTEFTIPKNDLEIALKAKLQDRMALFDATELSRVLLGDSIYSNMMVFGAAWQKGAVPLTLASIRQAIRLNGAAVDANLKAFEIGRWAIAHPDQANGMITAKTSGKPMSLQDKIDFRYNHLIEYQSKSLADKYRQAVRAIADPDLRLAVAEGYHKVLSYKDEYEVARLHLKTAAKVAESFEGVQDITWHLAPPVLTGKDQAGRPKKRNFGISFKMLMPVLASMKSLRGTPLDPFGWTADRRAERRLIAEYESDLPRLTAATNRQAAIDLARLPLSVRGFGPVKDKAIAEAAVKRLELLNLLDQPVSVAAE
ncbi:MAG: indolepyruvate ferredoxin oxidoreductase family protein, partial [Rhodobacteraceae bacterium]|nr:indolepyruvate ferredoxin oxidoreductase family protein [Paracoccaceae bacterium]